MGRESKISKPRKCENCGDITYSDAQELADHAKICKRATDAGLVLVQTQIIAV